MRVARRGRLASEAATAERPAEAERAARATLRAQIAKLERELSEIVADRFPLHRRAGASARSGAPRRRPVRACRTSRELERSRDRLAGRLQELRRRARRAAPSTSAARASCSSG